MGGSQSIGGWCAESYWCFQVYWCSLPNFLRASCLVMLCWAAVFYLLALVLYPRLADEIRRRLPSKIAEEEGPYNFAQHIYATLVSLVVISMCIGPAWHLSSAKPDTQFLMPVGEFDLDSPE